uniref:Uncharacterized protein n=1 Tax=Mycena chlorophos TaxID=658473 RepID=A0ABQ0LL68_MYCCL|nr:predicted protein [Mycena chlorophos]
MALSPLFSVLCSFTGLRRRHRWQPQPQSHSSVQVPSSFPDKELSFTEAIKKYAALSDADNYRVSCLEIYEHPNYGGGSLRGRFTMIDTRIDRCSHVTGPLQCGSLSITYADIKQAPSISNLAAAIAAVDSISPTCKSGANPGACFNHGLALLLLIGNKFCGGSSAQGNINIYETSGWTAVLKALRIPKHIPREECLAHMGKIYDEQLVDINRLRELQQPTPDALQALTAGSETSTLSQKHNELLTESTQNKAPLDELHSKIAENDARIEKLEAMLAARAPVGEPDISPEYSEVDSELR